MAQTSWQRKPLLGLAALLALIVAGYLLGGHPVVSPGGTTPATASGTVSAQQAAVSASALPAQARDVLTLIDHGGPFPDEQDGAVFGNREGLLPPRADGYYREYTVDTPGEGDRGARRLVIGAAGEIFYTADHYASFARVVRP